MGALVTHLALLDDKPLDNEARRHVEAMLANVDRMINVLGDLTAALELEPGKSTPLAILTRGRRMQRGEPGPSASEKAE
jgi:hypothetical protein